MWLTTLVNTNYWLSNIVKGGNPYSFADIDVNW